MPEECFLPECIVPTVKAEVELWSADVSRGPQWINMMINGLNRLDWLDHSSDLNPIKNLWDELDHRIKLFSNHPKS
ncbi:hypothetical protein TNCV_297031 [Trichonephila clavipes]|nr:hypothetical protein TNCV_297031 [Trichonephila clavipes]